MTVRSVFWSGLGWFFRSCFSKKERVNKDSVGNKGPSFFCWGGFGGDLCICTSSLDDDDHDDLVMVIMMVYQ